ncbi:hypothetical protein HPB51_007151 [Rhipicephalus microplus]|uniref:Uncharacterized protein n=1 Tax=Rhipicephalus microplus TaxID=6941 RepID=A0A9J6E0H9_RHIMP|nr:hypothetical protein HPB51_007151 [Rhipicephalus microplus]
MSHTEFVNLPNKILLAPGKHCVLTSNIAVIDTLVNEAVGTLQTGIAGCSSGILAQFSQWWNCHVLGPDEDLTGVAVEEDDTEQTLEAALTKARRLRLAEGSSLQKIAESARLARDQDDVEDKASSAKAIVLNSTAEFCRTLGDIPTYGMSGNRDEEAEELLDMDIDKEEEDEEAGDASKRGAWNEVDIEEKPVEIKVPHLVATYCPFTVSWSRGHAQIKKRIA